MKQTEISVEDVRDEIRKLIVIHLTFLLHRHRYLPRAVRRALECPADLHLVNDILMQLGEIPHDPETRSSYLSVWGFAEDRAV